VGGLNDYPLLQSLRALCVFVVFLYVQREMVSGSISLLRLPAPPAPQGPTFGCAGLDRTACKRFGASLAVILEHATTVHPGSYVLTKKYVTPSKSFAIRWAEAFR
jgi:hypothetical protein